MEQKSDLRDLTFPELELFFRDLGEKPFRARQVARWLYKGGADSFERMSDLSKDLRARLEKVARVSWLEPEKVEESADGVRKLLFGLAGGGAVESVLIPEEDHHTLCVSSQVGCRQGCAFCKTATLGFSRNLTPAEIMGQILTARSLTDEEKPLTNLVFMGMGEPLDNLANLTIALSHILGEHGLQMSQRKVTVSTVGLADKLPLLGAASPAALAVSLNAVEDELRSRLMPVNRRFPLAELKKVLAVYPLKPTRRITFEYVLLGGVNDSPAQARHLAAWLGGLKAKVNLIPFNYFEGAAFAPPSAEAVEEFKETLAGLHVTAMVRRSRGPDISAACGQLAGRRRP